MNVIINLSILLYFLENLVRVEVLYYCVEWSSVDLDFMNLVSLKGFYCMFSVMCINLFVFGMYLFFLFVCIFCLLVFYY